MNDSAYDYRSMTREGVDSIIIMTMACVVESTGTWRLPWGRRDTHGDGSHLRRRL